MSDIQFLTERELGARLRCSVPAIRAWRKRGLPARRFGRLVRFDLPEVLAWFERQEHAPQSLARSGESDDVA